MGLLNPLIDAVLAITGTALVAILTVFFMVIGKLSNALDTSIFAPIRNTIRRIHIPVGIKIIFFLLLGSLIVTADHFYGKRFSQSDETIQFYQIVILDRSFWISQIALLFGGFFICLAMLYILGLILKVVNNLLDRRIRLTIVFSR